MTHELARAPTLDSERVAGKKAPPDLGRLA